ncbi:hypothetical protein N9033_01010, partial [bacterium]|nr:hypothetical protein [bacterium]
NFYDTNGSQSRQEDTGSITKYSDWSNTRFYYGNGLPTMWWYAHDGQGNSMLVTTTVGWTSDHGTNHGYSYNGLWGAGNTDTGRGGAMPMSSGGYDFQPPPYLPSATNSQGNALQSIQQFANDQRNTWVYKNSTDLVQPAWHQESVIAAANNNPGWRGTNNINRMILTPAGHLAEIIHGLTPFGDNADLSQPQNLYLHRYGTKYMTNRGTPNTSYKFGNLVKTNSQNCFKNGEGRGKNGSVYTQHNNSVMNGTPDLSLHLIAKREIDSNSASGKSPVKINMYTCGGHTVNDGPPTRQESDTLFFEFPGVGTTYGAVHKDSVVSTENAAAWSNITALVDPTNTLDAVCKASGEENAVYVLLSGMTEGPDSEPDSGDMVGLITVTLGGTRKLVLGPQVLKCQIVENDGTTAVTGAKTIPGQGSDTLQDDITLVYQSGEDLFDCTYDKVQDAKIKIWVETPN